MRKKVTALAVTLCVAWQVCALPQEERPKSGLKVRQETQRSESEASSQTVSSEQLEQIEAVIDGMRDQWISEVTEKDERIFRLGERKKFWFRVSICEALVIAAGAYIMYATNK